MTKEEWIIFIVFGFVMAIGGMNIDYLMVGAW